MYFQALPQFKDNINGPILSCSCFMYHEALIMMTFQHVEGAFGITGICGNHPKFTTLLHHQNHTFLKKDFTRTFIII